MNAYLVGSLDRHVAELLHASGVRTTLASSEELAALINPSAQQPDVVVLDLRGRATTVPPAVALLKRQHPLTGVLIVASHLDPTLMLEAMRAGVNEFVTDPVTPRELKAAIDRVVAKQPTQPPGQVFAFVGGKGGVGTTTLAVNVATVLAAREPSSTLLIDLNVAYGDAAMFLGIEPRFSVADALENVDRVDETFLRGVVGHTNAGLDVLAASDRSLIGHIEVPAVRSIIDCAAGIYSCVVLDVPRADTMLDALDPATRIIVVANQELATVRSASRMAAALRQRYGKERVAVVVTRFDQHAEIGRKDIERVIGGPVADVFPSNYRAALDALNTGRPLVLDNHNKLASSYSTFARSLVSETPAEPAATERPSGILGRLSLRL